MTRWVFNGRQHVLAMAILLLLSGVAWPQSPAVRPLVVGSEEDYPPFATGKTDETASGFTVDLWKAVAAEKGLNYTIRVRPFRNLLEEFKAGKIDVMINLAQSDERRAFADFSVPHVIVHGGIFVRKGGPAIRSEADLAGKSIIVLNADLAHDYAVSKGWGKQLVLVDTAAAGLKLLASGQHDAMLLSKLVGMQTLLGLGVKNVTALDEKAGFSQKFCFTVHKGDAELLAAINEGLAVAKAGGKYDALYEKWFGVFEVREVGLRDVLKYLAPVAIGLLILGGFMLVRHWDRKIAEFKLKESEERLRLAMAGANQGWYDLNVQTGECVVSPEYARMLGYTPGEFHETNAAWIARLHPDERDAVFQVYSDYVAGRRPDYRVEFRQRTKTGQWKWILSLGSLVARTPDGKPLRMLGTHTDISARKEAEEALQESELRFRTLTGHAPVGILMSDVQGDCLFVNERWCAITGTKPEEAMGTGWLTAVHPEDRHRVSVAWRGAAASGADFVADFRLQAPDGRITFVQGTGTALRDEQGEVKGLVGTVTDLTARMQAEADLKSSEERYRTIVETSRDGIWSLDAEARTMFTNRRMAEMLGYTVEEMRGRPVFDFMDAVAQQEAASSLEKLRQGIGQEREIRLLRKDGTDLWVLVSANPLPRVDGAYRGGLAMVTDITKRKEAEMAMQQSQEHLRTIMELAPECVKLVSPDGRLLEMNPAGLAILGATSLEQVRGCPLVDIVVPEDRATFSGMLQRVLEGEIGRCEFTITTLQGVRRTLETHTVPYRNSRREIVGALGVTRDITQRKEAAAELERTFSTLQLFINSVPAYISFVDAEQRYRLVNRRYEEYFGQPAERIVGKLVRELQTPESYAEMQPHIREALAGRMVSYESNPTGPDGKARWFDVQYVPRAAGDGAVHGFFVLVFDITERKETEFARRELDRKMLDTQKLESLGVLAGGIAHDFNNILTAILGNASLALNEVSPGSSVHESLDQITQASLRAAELCKQMLAYSGRGRFVVRRLDLGEFISETAQMLRISISKKAILRFSLGAGLPPIEADATQIRQVILNLVINASEAIGDRGGVIQVSTGLAHVDQAFSKASALTAEVPEGDYVFMEVSDDGPGISAETRAKIFDPFFTTKFTGRGLGLAAVLGIVRGHKGAIEVRSEPGRGTSFRILFPAATGPAEPAPTGAAHPPQWHGQGTVLVVDDEETIRMTVKRMLPAMGMEPVLASDGVEALEIFRADPARFALVLLDLTMPRMDGEETFAELRRLRADVPVVLMSGFSKHEALAHFTGKGLANFLQKPFAFEALQAVIRDVLG